MQTVAGGVESGFPKDISAPLPAFRKGRGLTTTPPPHIKYDRGGRDTQLDDPGPDTKISQGSAVITGDGVETQFRWLHGLVAATPNNVNVAHSTGLAQPSFTTAVDASYVTITFEDPLRSGSFTMKWEVVGDPVT